MVWPFFYKVEKWRIFKLVAQLQINGPVNLNAVKSKINQQLKGINANINLKISPNAARGMNSLNTAAGKLDKTLQSLTRTITILFLSITI